MKLVIISDAHGNEENIKQIINSYSKYKDITFLCAGDSCLPSYSLFPFISIKGNCDFYQFDNLLTIDTPIGKLLMRHYPFYGYEIDKYEKLGYKIFVYGHTHKKEAKIINNDIYLFNPGSISLPRDSDTPSYLLIDIDEETKQLKYEFKYI
ncbi:MAG: metallophosphoesterase family protein [Bacilli bacterium]